MADNRDRDIKGDPKGPKTNNILHHDDHPGVGDHVGEAAGGISGVLTGAAIGSVGGPIGTIIGGIAGAMGGWWAGRTVSEAATHLTGDDDTYYRKHYETSKGRLADRSYDDVRPAYQVGHLAAHNPDYTNRDWTEVERDLQRGWSGDVAKKHGDWNNVRDYAREGWTRGRSTASTAGAKVERGADRVADKAANAADRTKAAASNAWEKTKNAADDMKDRVDGNPASRPGPDSTDRPGRRM